MVLSVIHCFGRAMRRTIQYTGMKTHTDRHTYACTLEGNITTKYAQQAAAVDATLTNFDSIRSKIKKKQGRENGDGDNKAKQLVAMPVNS